MSLLYENIIEIGFVKWGPKPEIIVLEILKDNIQLGNPNSRIQYSRIQYSRVLILVKKYIYFTQNSQRMYKIHIRFKKVPKI